MVEGRAPLLKQGLKLEAITIGWMLTMATVSAAQGIQDRSALLITVAAGSAVDVAAAAAVYWRLTHEQKAESPEHSQLVERRVSRFVAVLLLAAALYAIVMASYKILSHTGADNSWPGIVVVAITAAWMQAVGRGKVRLSRALNSPALKASGAGTVVCAMMSVVVLIGLALSAWLKWWWVDSVGALLLVPFLVREAYEAWVG